MPTGVTDIWNPITGEFDFSELKNGDMIDIRLEMKIITASANTEIEIDLFLGDGAGAYQVPFAVKQNFKSTGTHTINRFNGIYIGDDNTRLNGGKFKIDTDTNCTFTVVGWYCKIIRKG